MELIKWVMSHQKICFGQLQAVLQDCSFMLAGSKLHSWSFNQILHDLTIFFEKIRKRKVRLIFVDVGGRCTSYSRKVWCSYEEQWFDAGRPLPDLYFPPAGCSPVAAELNHCEHGWHSLFTCGLSPVAAQPGYTAICSLRRARWVCLCANMQIGNIGVTLQDLAN